MTAVKVGQPIFWDWMRLLRRAELGFGTGKKRVASDTVQHVALVACTYANPDGTRIHPGEERLARVCRKNLTTIRACLKRLRDVGLLVRVFEGSKAGRGSGLADEYHLAIPEDIAERVAMLDPDERDLVVPDGVEPPPVNKPRAKTPAPAADVSPGAAPADSPVDNPVSPGAAPADEEVAQEEHRVLPAVSPGAAPRITGCSTRPPTHAPPMHLPHTLSSPYGAGLEGAPARREEPPAADVTRPSATPSTSPAWMLAALGQADLDAAYAKAFAALNRLPDFGVNWVGAARAELGEDTPRAHLVIRAHQLAALGQSA